MSGKTDTAILREALTMHQMDEAVVSVEVFHERYISRLRLTLQEAHRPRRLMPGDPFIYSKPWLSSLTWCSGY